MDAYDHLRKLARQKRDRAIQAARAEYHQTLLSINTLRARVTQKRLPRATALRIARSLRTDDLPFSELTTIAAAERVLRERGPLRIVEIAVEVQERGHRAGDDPRRLVPAIRAAFRYHQEKFRKGKDGRWGLAVEQ